MYILFQASGDSLHSFSIVSITRMLVTASPTAVLISLVKARSRVRAAFCIVLVSRTVDNKIIQL